MERVVAAAIAGLGFCFCLGAATAQPGACLDPASIAEPDIAGAAAALSDPSLCISEKRFTENGIDWRLFVIQNKAWSGPLWAVPHDDEDAGFTAAVYAVATYGGTIVALEADEKRNFGGVDPNHIFRPLAAPPSVCPEAPAGSPVYTAAYLDEWDRAFPVVGLHSNWDGHNGAGGLGTISIYRPDAKMIPFPSTNGEGRLADEDTVLMIPSMAPPEDNPPGMASIAWFNERGVHVLYRKVAGETLDCTFADYLTLDGIGPYFNIEVEHGDAETQKAVIDRLMEFLDSGVYAGML
jgi:hypothetical protein